MKRFWCSWWHPYHESFEMKDTELQIWVSGYRRLSEAGPYWKYYRKEVEVEEECMDECSLCAVIDAESEDWIKDKIQEYFPGSGIRFIQEVDRDHVPGDRFPNFENKTKIDTAPDIGPEKEEPVNEMFGLTYASYYVVPRVVLQSMPVEWQKKFVALVKEMNSRIPWEVAESEYHVVMTEKYDLMPEEEKIEYTVAVTNYDDDSFRKELEVYHDPYSPVIRVKLEEKKDG